MLADLTLVADFIAATLTFLYIVKLLIDGAPSTEDAWEYKKSSLRQQKVDRRYRWAQAA